MILHNPQPEVICYVLIAKKQVLQTIEIRRNTETVARDTELNSKCRLSG